VTTVSIPQGPLVDGAEFKDHKVSSGSGEDIKYRVITAGRVYYWSRPLHIRPAKCERVRLRHRSFACAKDTSEPAELYSLADPNLLPSWALTFWIFYTRHQEDELLLPAQSGAFIVLRADPGTDTLLIFSKGALFRNQTGGMAALIRTRLRFGDRQLIPALAS